MKYEMARYHSERWNVKQPLVTKHWSLHPRVKRPHCDWKVHPFNETSKKLAAFQPFISLSPFYNLLRAGHLRTCVEVKLLEMRKNWTNRQMFLVRYFVIIFSAIVASADSDVAFGLNGRWEELVTRVGVVCLCHAMCVLLSFSRFHQWAE